MQFRKLYILIGALLLGVSVMMTLYMRKASSIALVNPSCSSGSTDSDANQNSCNGDITSFDPIVTWPFDAKEARSHQLRIAEQLDLPVEGRLPIAQNHNLDLVLIPPGRYLKGAKSSGGSSHHWTEISKPFYIGKYEITWGDYTLFKQNAHLTNLTYKERTAAGLVISRYPLDTASWDTCVAFCRDVSLGTKCSVRLPTDDEWEYVCRAGVGGDFSLQQVDKSPGDTWLNEVRRRMQGRVGGPKQVGTESPNPFGVHDMVGSVSEWVMDTYSNDSSIKVIRGKHTDRVSAVVYRYPGLCSDTVSSGFRVVVEITTNLKATLLPASSALTDSPIEAHDEAVSK